MTSMDMQRMIQIPEKPKIHAEGISRCRLHGFVILGHRCRERQLILSRMTLGTFFRSLGLISSISAFLRPPISMRVTT